MATSRASRGEQTVARTASARYAGRVRAFHALADQDAPDVRHRSSGPGRPSVATEPPVARAPLRFCDPARSHVWYSVFSLEQLSSVLKEAGPKACFIGANTGPPQTVPRTLWWSERAVLRETILAERLSCLRTSGLRSESTASVIRALWGSKEIPW
ncbi:unnamed protein product [Prorocentrum cordatum]|uniref:Uncharacterized protein n=1 Tax=Prorocentrum cordatum TaxID=2364126 RepID=A0ABN9TBZ2_9DINO|nr:unnamed protein product [Polarella glacialis]